MRRRKIAGFTLPELMVATAIGSVIMAGLATGAIALQRGYAAADYSLRCQLDQMRVLDYIARDVRRATNVTTANADRKLVLSIPDQRESGTQALRVPTLVNGVVQYGSAPVEVAYYIEGNVFLREEAGVRTAIAVKRLENFLVTVNAATGVTVQLAFTPQFSMRAGYGQTAATIVTRVPLPAATGIY